MQHALVVAAEVEVDLAVAVVKDARGCTQVLHYTHPLQASRWQAMWAMWHSRHQTHDAFPHLVLFPPSFFKQQRTVFLAFVKHSHSSNLRVPCPIAIILRRKQAGPTLAHRLSHAIFDRFPTHEAEVEVGAQRAQHRVVECVRANAAEVEAQVEAEAQHASRVRTVVASSRTSRPVHAHVTYAPVQEMGNSWTMQPALVVAAAVEVDLAVVAAVVRPVSSLISNCLHLSDAISVVVKIVLESPPGSRIERANARKRAQSTLHS